ncbi:hypothetical protein M0802_010883 [Mischocyttarus mexicanus]|nr:hypothetical protein M0802_010883 [Mischocyttarus mexicanus]
MNISTMQGHNYQHYHHYHYQHTIKQPLPPSLVCKSVRFFDPTEARTSSDGGGSDGGGGGVIEEGKGVAKLDREKDTSVHSSNVLGI